MVAIVIVKKSGDLETLNVKEFRVEELYKKCGFKQSDGFEQAHEWCIKEYKVRVYGKTNGRANTENKYDFPPPIDNVLFFGSCAIVG